MHDFDQRFGGIARLVSAEGLARLRAAHVCVVGIGGVGSWTVEALARSGVGALTLIDLDEVCITNVNRQLHALDGTVGRAKVEVMAERVRLINPECRVSAVAEFFTEATAARLLTPDFSYVVDAIDAVANKCRLLALCRARKLPVIACGAAGGRLDATAVRLADLADATHDRLLAEVRKRLRKEHGFPPPGEPTGVACVFSAETPVLPEPPACAEAGQGSDSAPRLNCEWGYGSATFVTGTFGFAAAGAVVRRLAA
ncbi:MAG: tRNA cyclic N6-threonylcarbamoyladenosine(37) synthase TcdA [Pedosphaera sp. Tous-C6FEB]|nr:MAG: tRNA cyclic N6-threonylcarbamoyladenosine(37) synthase TcdA [Pedosphaera sp. Tous-C6FEB]